MQMPQAGEYGKILMQFLPIVLLIVVFYFLLIRPQKKRDRAEKEMRNSISVGDEISTIGGIIGRVVTIKEDVFVLETSGDRSKIKMYRWAIRGKEQAEAPAEKLENS
ncbi:preprotein translocase subunit YajC [Intestinibacillus massiliensis]|uniref:preprotein translocase subunit YajC n=1 Tax=Intestinibacillus massiliensis TaxID=1871029 RepID=UPI001D08A16B|nr:preprotein translocase subunit YajC [Intestinibacillus massiliensis]MCB6367052.1 preprotein translocase subunit YajC [Intestinibacillus massiliensis]